MHKSLLSWTWRTDSTWLEYGKKMNGKLLFELAMAFTNIRLCLVVYLMPPPPFKPGMNEILWEVLSEGVVVDIDDILIYSEDPKDHTTLVGKVLQRLRDFQMPISPEKSVFHVKMVDFLGYIVTTDGVTMNEKKVETIKAWKPPTSVREVQIFMGFGNFYQRFIKNFSDICTPIMNLTKGDKTKFTCGKDQQEAFEYLKRCFTRHQSFVTSTQTATRSSWLMQASTPLVAFFHSFRKKDCTPSPSTRAN